METTIEVGTLAEAVDVLLTIAARVENPPVDKSLRQCAEIVEARTIKNFLYSEDPQGIGWKPPKYRRRPPPTLVVTGTLQRAAAVAAMKPTIMGSELLIEVPDPYYGVFHLTGTSKMVPRVWLGVTEEHVEQMADLTAANTAHFIATGEP